MHQAFQPVEVLPFHTGYPSRLDWCPSWSLVIDWGHIKSHHVSISVTFILFFRNHYLSPSDGHESMMILEAWCSRRSSDEKRREFVTLNDFGGEIKHRKKPFSPLPLIEWLLPGPDIIPSSIWHFYQPISSALFPPPPPSSLRSHFLPLCSQNNQTWRGSLGREAGDLHHKTKLYQQEEETS